MPGYGRLEIQPPANRKLPQPAESYHQSWSAQSDPPQPPQAEVPFYPPPVIVAPQVDVGPPPVSTSIAKQKFPHQEPRQQKQIHRRE